MTTWNLLRGVRSKRRANAAAATGTAADNAPIAANAAPSTEKKPSKLAGVFLGTRGRQSAPQKADAAAKSAAEYSARAQPASARASLDPEAQPVEANTTTSKPAGPWPSEPKPSQPRPSPPQAPQPTMTSPREPKPPALEAVQPAVQPAIKVPSVVPRAAEHAAEASATTPSSSLMGGLDAESRIKVVVRIRPLSTKHKRAQSTRSTGSTSTVASHTTTTSSCTTRGDARGVADQWPPDTAVRQEGASTVHVSGVPSPDGKEKTQEFKFDTVLGADATQEEVFDMVGRPLVQNVVRGYNACCFAYGQSGSGKTHTMTGPPPPRSRSDSGTGSTASTQTTATAGSTSSARLPRRPASAAGTAAEPPPEAAGADSAGLAQRVFRDLFEVIAAREGEVSADVQYTCRCSYLQIYNEQVLDLLKPESGARPSGSKPLQMRFDGSSGVRVERLTEEVIVNAEDALQVMATGAANRKFAETASNRISSRSHCVFTVAVECTTTLDSGLARVTSGRLHIVDLAGSERSKVARTAGRTLAEANDINQSLSALGRVISKVGEAQKQKARLHVPYRDSKLTFLLQDSIGGNARTVLIACVNPSAACVPETLSTLQFARCAGAVCNTAKTNVDTRGGTAAMHLEIERLRRLLAARQDGGATAALEAERAGLQADLRIASEALRETVDRLELYQVQRQQMEAALRRFDARLGQRDRLIVKLEASLEAALELQKATVAQNQKQRAHIQSLETASPPDSSSRPTTPPVRGPFDSGKTHPMHPTSPHNSSRTRVRGALHHSTQAGVPYYPGQRHRSSHRHLRNKGRPSDPGVLHQGSGGDGGGLAGMATLSSFSMDGGQHSPLPQRACASATATAAISAAAQAPFQPVRPVGVPAWNPAQLDSVESQSPSAAVMMQQRVMLTGAADHAGAGTQKTQRLMQQPRHAGPHPALGPAGPAHVSGVDVPAQRGSVGRIGAAHSARGAPERRSMSASTRNTAAAAAPQKASDSMHGAELYLRQQRAMHAAVQAAATKAVTKAGQLHRGSRRRQPSSARTTRQPTSARHLQQSPSAASYTGHDGRSQRLAALDMSESQMLHESLQETLQEALDGIGTRWSEMQCYDQADQVEVLRTLQERHAASLRALEDTWNRRLKEELDSQANMQAQQLIQVLEAHQTALTSVNSHDSASLRTVHSPAHGRDHNAWAQYQRQQRRQRAVLPSQQHSPRGLRSRDRLAAMEPDSSGMELGGDSSFMGFDMAGGPVETDSSSQLLPAAPPPRQQRLRPQPQPQPGRQWQRQRQLEGWPEEETALSVAESLADAAAVRAELEDGFRRRVEELADRADNVGASAAFDSTMSGRDVARRNAALRATPQPGGSDGGSPAAGGSATVRLRKMQSFQGSSRDVVDSMMSQQTTLPVTSAPGYDTDDTGAVNLSSIPN